MIWKILNALLGRKMKNDAVNAVMEKVNLPDPVSSALKVAATGKVGGLVADVKKVTTKKKVSRK
jgi:hypothetical protein